MDKTRVVHCKREQSLTLSRDVTAKRVKILIKIESEPLSDMPPLRMKPLHHSRSYQIAAWIKFKPTNSIYVYLKKFD